MPPTGLGAKPLSARKTPGARQTFAAPPEITLPGDRYGVVVVVATVVVVAAVVVVVATVVVVASVVVASVVTPWVVVVGVDDAGHLPDASGATSPCLSPDLTAFLETLIFTQRPDLPALWQSVTFLSACLALPLPLSPVSEVVVVESAVVVVVAPVVVPAEGLGFFPLPCPLSATANDVQAPATKSASASALSFTVRSFRSFDPVVGSKDASHKENLAFSGHESPHRVTPRKRRRPANAGLRPIHISRGAT
jgi:hypothetical protein